MFPQLLPVFRSLESRKVRYLVIGGVAVIYYGVNRLTNDLDLLFDATVDNASNLLAALEEAQFGSASLTSVEDLLKTDITILKDRVRIDVPVNIIARSDLLAAKRAAGRKVDFEDIRRLETK